VRPEQLGIVRSETFQGMANCGAVRVMRDGRCFVVEPVAREFLYHYGIKWISVTMLAIVFT
jgi:hypothetical protein